MLVKISNSEARKGLIFKSMSYDLHCIVEYSAEERSALENSALIERLLLEYPLPSGKTAEYTVKNTLNSVGHTFSHKSETDRSSLEEKLRSKLTLLEKHVMKTAAEHGN